MNAMNRTTTTSAEVEQMMAHVIDHNRHGDSIDRVLARVGDEVDSHYGEFEELVAQGVDVVALYEAFTANVLSGSQFGTLLRHLSVESVNVLLVNRIDFNQLVVALRRGVLDGWQVDGMVDNLDAGDFDTGVYHTLDRAGVTVEVESDELCVA